MRISTFLLRVIAFALVAMAMPIFRAQALAGPSTCEDIFRKEKFVSPSVMITATGRIEAKLTNSESALGKFVNAVTRYFYRPLSLDKIEAMTQRLAADQRDVPFWEKFSDAFGLEIQIDPKALETIPRTGSLIIAANHAQNGVEGIALAALISKVRPDVKVVLTDLLDVIPGVAENAIFANPYGDEKARVANVASLDRMVQHLREGHVLIIFPTGTVSGKNKLRDVDAVDGRWRKGLAYLVRNVPETRVQPMFVEGQPSNAFLNMTVIADRYLSKMPGLRIAVGAVFHVREIANRIGQDIALTIGPAIEGSQILAWGNMQQIMNHLKVITYDLKASREVRNLKLVGLPKLDLQSSHDDLKSERVQLPIANAEPMVAVQAELMARARVIYDMAPGTDKRVKVYVAKGRDIPIAMREVGRLREITFRDVGEGSGRSRDLDAFDDDYVQLIAIDKKSGEIMGGYRLGQIDEIVAAKGFGGVYTSAFFDHRKMIEPRMDSSLEVGRSFVVPKYQRSLALLALFSAIGRFVVENPRYKNLMGPVSISNEVSERSRGLMIEYLRMFHESPEAVLVTPLMPLKKDFVLDRQDLGFLKTKPSLRMLSERVEEIETGLGNSNTVPPLIPIYIGLGAQFFKFNIDIEFNTLDGLIVTDLSKLQVADLKNYMGEEGAKQFLEYHARQNFLQRAAGH